jgi:hypothetical protein
VSKGSFSILSLGGNHKYLGAEDFLNGFVKIDSSLLFKMKNRIVISRQKVRIAILIYIPRNNSTP